MLPVSRKTFFAIEAILDIAFHTEGDSVHSREITRRQAIPKRYLEQTLQQFVKYGLLKGVRGPKGGYHLARDRGQITLGQIISAIHDNEIDHLSLNTELGSKVIHPIFKNLHKKIMLELESITIDDLCNLANNEGIISELAQKIDYSI
jgi:Rrf2 family protein